MDASRTTNGRSEGAAGRTRTLLLVAIAATLALTAIVSTRPAPVETTRTSAVEEHGLEWGEVTIVHADDRTGKDGAVVEATVLLDGGAFPAATARDDRFVMFQLGDGRFDEDRFSDDSRAERVVGLGDDDVLQFAPGPRTGVPPHAMPQPGRYTMSLDGRVRYDGVEAGRMALRAYVVDRDGRWDGEVALREVRVR